MTLIQHGSLRFSGRDRPTNPNFRTGDKAVYISQGMGQYEPDWVTITDRQGHDGQIRESRFKTIHRDEVDRITFVRENGQEQTVLAGEIEYQQGPRRVTMRYPAGTDYSAGLFSLQEFLAQRYELMKRRAETEKHRLQKEFDTKMTGLDRLVARLDAIAKSAGDAQEQSS